MKTSFFFLLMAALALEAETDWPRFRGPNGAGISDATGIPVTWTETDYRWKITLPGTGHSSPVIVGRRLFVTCADDITATRKILCLDALTGKQLWLREYPSKPFPKNKDNSNASATPAADTDGVVITWNTSEEVILLALDNDGREVWKRNFGPYIGAHGSAISPVIAAGLVILDNSQEDPAANPDAYKGTDSPKQAGKSFVVAVERATGRTRWQLDRLSGKAAYATPCVREDRELIVCSTQHGFSGIDLVSGKLNWELVTFDRRVVSSPVLHGDLVINGCGGGGAGFRYFAVKAGPRPQVVYQVERPVPYVPTALVKDDRLFLWGDNGIVTCLRASTGERLWCDRVPSAFYASPVWIGGRLYNIAKNGDVFVIGAGDKFELLSRIPLGEKSHASPAVAHGRLYLRTLSQVFALGGSPP